MKTASIFIISFLFALNCLAMYGFPETMIILSKNQKAALFIGPLDARDLIGSGYFTDIQQFHGENFPSEFTFKDGTVLYPEGYVDPSEQ